MRSLSLIFVVLFAFTSCSKKTMEPEGPTDLRITNVTDKIFSNVNVDTGGGEHNFGDIAPHTSSEYFRFEKSYPDIEVVLSIDGVQYTNGEPDNTYAVYLGQIKTSYEVHPTTLGSGVLVVTIVYPYDGPIDDL